MDAIVVKRNLYAWCVMVAAFSLAFILLTYLNVVSGAKRQVDPQDGKGPSSEDPGGSVDASGSAGARNDAKEIDGTGRKAWFTILYNIAL
jgi:hypothetical protein